MKKNISYLRDQNEYPKLKHQLKNPFHYLLIGLLFLSINSLGQHSLYKENQVIKIASGEILKVISCKGEGADQKCQLQHFVNNKPVGKPFWLLSNKIMMQQQLTLVKKIAVKPAATITVALHNAEPRKTFISKPVIVIKEPERIPSAPVVEETYPAFAEKENTVVAKEVKEKAAAPKKVKKEFVSHNPFLLQPYKKDNSTAKKSTDSLRLN